MKINIDLNDAFKETEITIHTHKAFGKENDVHKLINYIENFDKQNNFLSFKTNESIEILNQNEIIYIEITQRDITIITEKQQYQTKGRLYQIMENLDSTLFIQVSKSAIVNVTQLIRLENYFSGSMIVILKNGYKVPVTRVYLPKLKEYFNI